MKKATCRRVSMKSTTKKALVHPKEFTPDQDKLRAVDEKSNESIEISIEEITNLKIQEGV